MDIFKRMADMQTLVACKIEEMAGLLRVLVVVDTVQGCTGHKG